MASTEVRVAVRNTFLVYTEEDGAEVEILPRRPRAASDSAVERSSSFNSDVTGSSDGHRDEAEGKPAPRPGNDSTAPPSSEDDAGAESPPPTARSDASSDAPWRTMSGSSGKWGPSDTSPQARQAQGCGWGQPAPAQFGGREVLVLPPIYVDSPFEPVQVPKGVIPYLCAQAPGPLASEAWRHAAPSPPKAARRGGAATSGRGATVHGARTTAMLKNLPSEYTRNGIIELLDEEGFGGLYDFVYLPMDFRSGHCLGYCFVNFVTPCAADQFRQHFHGFDRWSLLSHKVAEVCWSNPLQGLEEHLQRYRDSPLMHESVPDNYRPVALAGGVRVPFPPPTKKLKAPRAKHATHSFVPANYQR